MGVSDHGARAIRMRPLQSAIDQIPLKGIDPAAINDAAKNGVTVASDNEETGPRLPLKSTNARLITITPLSPKHALEIITPAGAEKHENPPDQSPTTEPKE